MRQRRWGLSVLILWWSLGAMVAWGADDLTVKDFAPQGEVTSLSRVEVVFSGPMVPANRVGKAVSREGAPCAFSPKLNGSWKWKDASTCVFTPASPLAPATTYTASVRDDLRDAKQRRISGRLSYTFATPPLMFLRLAQKDFSEERRLALDLHFSLPVNPVRLRGYLELSCGGTPVAYDLPGGEPSRRLSLRTDPLPQGKLTVKLSAGLPPARGDRGLLKEVTKDLAPVFVLAVSNAYAQSDYPGRGRITVNTTAPVDTERAASFVALAPAVPFTVEPEYNGFAVVGDFSPRDRVVLSLKKGLPGASGGKLGEEYRRAFVFPDVPPSLRFPGAGTYLSPLGDLRVPLEGVNVEKAELAVWRVFPNNVPVALGLQNDEVLDNLSGLVLRETLTLGGKVNEVTRRAVDLRELASPDRGIFLLTLRDASWNYWDTPRTVVAVTDLGMTAKIFPRGALVWVNSLKKLGPVAGAQVSLFSRSNQLLAQGTTDREGLLAISRDQPWPGDLMPHILTAETSGDASYLLVGPELLAGAGYGEEIGGAPYLDAGYEALVFTPRGVFRPGEVAEVIALVRQGDHRAPEPFPVEFVLTGADGREALRRTAMLSPQGFTEVRLPLELGARTGICTVRLRIPGDEKRELGSTTFQVEDFAPPRIEVLVRGDKKSLLPQQEVRLDVEGRYLFGAPAAELPFEGETFLGERTFVPRGWEGFTFGDSEKPFVPYQEFLGNATLDEEGRGRLTFAVPPRTTLGRPGTLHFRLGVMEEGGRWSYRTLSLPYDPWPVYLGLRVGDREASVGTRTRIPVGAVNRDGTPANVGAVLAVISRVVWHSALVEMDGRFRFQTREELVEQERSVVPLTNGRGELAFLPKDPGSYVVRLEEENSGSSAATRLFAYGEGGDGGAMPDRVNLTPSQKMYAEGEEARIRIASPFAGRALITVETDEVVWSRVMELQGRETEISVPVTAAMAPNAYVTAWVLRPVAEDSMSWISHRALGVASFAVDQQNVRLGLSLDVPETFVPGKPVTVSVRLTDGAGAPQAGEVTLALVDEGVLGLTDFVTPDPWAFFARKRALGVQAYDLYDDLLPVENGVTPLLHPGGGGDAEALLRSSLSPVRGRRFKPLALTVSPLSTDAEGRISVSFDVPEFSGKVRVMAVGAAESRTGAAAVQALVAREVVTEATLPRAVAPGDAFGIPVVLFSKGSRDVAVTVAVSADALLTFGAPEFRVTVPAGGKGASLAIPCTVGKGTGLATVTLTTSWERDTAIQTVELPVRPAAPRITLAGAAVRKGGEKGVLELPRKWFPGTERGVLVLGSSPRVELAEAVRYLETYPYGCLEQTVSGAWPLLALPDLVAEIDPELTEPGEIRSRLESAVRRILAFQNYDGGFLMWPEQSGGGWSWPGIYALHFLVAARREGVEVPAGPLEEALNGLRRQMTEPFTGEALAEDVLRDKADRSAYAAYVLALSGEAPLAWMEMLREDRAHLRGVGKTLLAGAYALAGERQGARDLLEPVALALNSPPSGQGTFSSGVRDRALQLLVETHLDASSPQGALLAKELLEALRQGLWRNTQENALALVAVGTYLRGTREDRRPFTATLTGSGGEVLAEATLDQGATLAVEKLPAAVDLSCAGEGTVYASWTVEGVPLEKPRPVSQGIVLERTFTDREGNLLREDEPIPQGTLVHVVLTVTSERDLRQCVLADLLAGGMEIDNPRLGVTQGDRDNPAITHVEPRDDRMLVFIDELRGGEPLTYTYRVRAVSRGTFTLPPASAEGMYDPAVRALVPGGTWRVE